MHVGMPSVRAAGVALVGSAPVVRGTAGLMATVASGT